jgi:hypothetical protein
VRDRAVIDAAFDGFGQVPSLVLARRVLASLQPGMLLRLTMAGEQN